MSHAKLSPSAGSRWTRCTAAPDFEAQFPDESSDAADEGTFAHDIAAICLEKGKSPMSFMARTSSCGRFKVDAEFVAHLETYVDAVRFAAEVAGADSVQIEQRVTLTDEIWGTADAWFLSGDGKVLHVFDLKFGAGVLVEVEDNVQLAIYGGAVLNEIDSSDEVEHVELHIVQPRIEHAAKPWRTWKLTAEELEARLAPVHRAAAEVKMAPKFVPGEHCRWCRGKAHCEAARERALSSAREAFVRQPVQPEALPIERVGELLAAFPRVREWMAAVEEHATKLAKAGKRIPGMKLVEKVGLRRWNDENEAAACLLSLGIDPYTKKLASPAQAEKLLKQAGMPPKQTKAEVSHLAHKPVTGEVLVPLSDRRPPLTTPNLLNPSPENHG